MSIMKVTFLDKIGMVASTALRSVMPIAWRAMVAAALAEFG
jgi:hypothetical protein